MPEEGMAGPKEPKKRRGFGDRKKQALPCGNACFGVVPTGIEPIS